MNPDRELIERCLSQDPKAQETLYRRFAPKMYGVCLRYARNTLEAEDILQEGFIKVFTYLKDYRFEGTLDGWVHRTIVNTAINYYRQQIREWSEINIDRADISKASKENIIDTLSLMDLLDIIQELPEGFRLVFNLYVIEGYNHQEIGQMLNISESTSKSQLSRARAALQLKIEQRNLNK